MYKHPYLWLGADCVLKLFLFFSCTMHAVAAIGAVEDVFYGTLQSDEHAYFQFKLPHVGMILKIEVNNGSVVVYISNKIRNPNEAIYDWKLQTNTSVDVFISMEGLGINSLSPLTATHQETMDNTETTVTIYVSVQGRAEKNNFILNTTYGDTTPAVKGDLCDQIIKKKHFVQLMIVDYTHDIGVMVTFSSTVLHHQLQSFPKSNN